MVGGLELFEETGLFLGLVGGVGLELGELGDGQTVVDEVGTVGGEGLLGLVELLLGFEEEKVIGGGEEDEDEDDFL